MREGVQGIMWRGWDGRWSKQASKQRRKHDSASNARQGSRAGRLAEEEEERPSYEAWCNGKPLQVAHFRCRDWESAGYLWWCRDSRKGKGRSTRRWQQKQDPGTLPSSNGVLVQFHRASFVAVILRYFSRRWGGVFCCEVSWREGEGRGSGILGCYETFRHVPLGWWWWWWCESWNGSDSVTQDV